MRIGGIASGMDTDTLIKDLMNANRIPLNKITQKKAYVEWQVNDYRAVNRQLFDFSQMTLDKMIMSTSFTPKNVHVSSPDDVAIKNMSSTSDFSGSLQIHQLAKNATLQSTNTGTDKLVPDGKSVDSKLEDWIDPNSFVDDKISINIKAPGGPAEGVDLEFGVNDSLSAVLSEINSKTGVNAFYDEQTGKIAMTAKNSGAGEIFVEGSLGEELKLTNTKIGKENTTSTGGVDARFTLNGLETSRSSNTFQINGFEISLKQVTAPLDGAGNVIPNSGKTITFNSAPDTDKIFDNIVKYVDEYNKLIEGLNSQIREPKYRSFQPLSAEEKKGMSDKEVEMWEEKAKSGTLRNDSAISSMLTEMRSALMGVVEKGGLSLKDIGITSTKSYLDNGKLVIDEAALKKAINEDPNKVHELFSKDGDKIEDQGFARRLRTIVDKTQTVIADKAGRVDSVNDSFTLGRTLKDMNKQIERFEDRLRMVEDRLWKQFTAMEQAINRANAQSAQLMSSLGGGA